MKRNLLVAISDDPSALYGVRFVSGFFQDKADLGLTLFSTYPRGPEVWEEEKSFETLRTQESDMDKSMAKFRKAIDKARQILVRAGFKGEEIEAKCSPRSFSKSMDIIQEGERGLYDAVVLGRRGIEGLETLVDESVTKQMLSDDTGCPVWVCRNPEAHRSGVLLCLDGSEPGYRMADHVGFMLEGHTGHKVTLFAVRKEAEPDEELAQVFARGRKQLLANNFPEELIQEKVVEAPRIAKAILEEAKSGEHAVVAVGRTGSGQTLLKRLFMGSVSADLMRHLTGAVLWFTR